jgi:hypothetical protein
MSILVVTHILYMIFVFVYFVLHFGKHNFAFLLYIYLGVELLSHRAHIYLALAEWNKIF